MNKKIGLWRPETDILSPSNVFCTNCVYVRAAPGKVEVFECRGHEPAGQVPDTPSNKTEATFAELGSVDTFSSDDYTVSHFKAKFVKGREL